MGFGQWGPEILLENWGPGLVPFLEPHAWKAFWFGWGHMFCPQISQIEFNYLWVLACRFLDCANKWLHFTAFNVRHFLFHETLWLFIIRYDRFAHDVLFCSIMHGGHVIIAMCVCLQCKHYRVIYMFCDCSSAAEGIELLDRRERLQSSHVHSGLQTRLWNLASKKPRRDPICFE